MHRTQSYNEMSARYTPLPNDNYTPTLERLMEVNQKNANKQANGTGTALVEDKAVQWLEQLETLYEHCQKVYEVGLELGVAKELARLSVPVGRYSKMRASANLLNWLKFCTLRSAPDAQYEIRVYANAIGELIKEAFPRTWEVYIGDK